MMKNNYKLCIEQSLFLFIILINLAICFDVLAEQSSFPVVFVDKKTPTMVQKSHLSESDRVNEQSQSIIINRAETDNKKQSFEWAIIDDKQRDDTIHKTQAKNSDSFTVSVITPQTYAVDNPEKQDIKPVIYFNQNQSAIEPPPQSIASNNVLTTSSSDELSLSKVIAKVIGWHPVIKRSINEISKSEEVIKEAKSGYFPSLKAGVQSSFEDNVYSSKNELEHNFVVSVTQNIYDFGKTSSNVALAEAAFDRDNFTKDQTVNKLIYDTATAYIEVVRYQNLIDIAQKQITGFEAINQIAKQRSKLGASAYSDYSQSLVRLASAKVMLHDYTAQYQRWSAVLNTLANQKISQNIPWTFPNRISDSCSSIDINHFNSPEMNIAEAQIKVAKAQLEKAKAEHYPTLSVSPTYEYRLDNNYNTYNRNKTRGDFGVFFNVSVQVMEGGGMNARTNEAQYALVAAQYNLDYERAQITQKILEASSQITSINFSLLAQKDKVASAIRTRDLYKQQYRELGNRQFSDLINAEAEIHQTKIEIINNQYNIQKLSIECLSNTGSLMAKLMTI